MDAEEMAGMGSWEWSATTGRVRWSPGMYRMRRTTPEETPDPSGIAFSVIPPDDVARLKEHAAAHRGASGVLEPIEYRRIWPDGTIEHLRAAGRRMPEEDPGDERFVGFVQDVTGIKKAEAVVARREAELETILQGSPDGILLIVDGRVEFANRAMETMLGYRREEIVGASALAFVPSEDRERAAARLSDVLRGAANPEPTQYLAVRKDGERLPVEVYSAPTEFQGRAALVSTIRDVRERKRMESTLARSRDSLRALSRHLVEVRETERSEIARDLHDDLGSLLTALKMDLALLPDADATARSASIESMTALVDQAMELGARITNRLRPGVLDQLGLVAAIEWVGRDAQGRAGFSLELDLPDDEPTLSRTVRTALFRILQEALTNVMRHADAGHVRIRLRLDEEHVHLDVTDDGVGMDLSDSPNGGGFGLLGIRERAQALGGSLEFESAPGEGTTLRVSIPRSEAG